MSKIYEERMCELQFHMLKSSLDFILQGNRILRLCNLKKKKVNVKIGKRSIG